MGEAGTAHMAHTCATVTTVSLGVGLDYGAVEVPLLGLRHGPTTLSQAAVALGAKLAVGDSVG